MTGPHQSLKVWDSCGRPWGTLVLRSSSSPTCGSSTCGFTCSWIPPHHQHPVHRALLQHMPAVRLVLFSAEQAGMLWPCRNMQEHQWYHGTYMAVINLVWASCRPSVHAAWVGQPVLCTEVSCRFSTARLTLDAEIWAGQRIKACQSAQSGSCPLLLNACSLFGQIPYNQRGAATADCSRRMLFGVVR